MLSAWNMSLKLAPKDSSMTYLAANALVCGIAATVAPLLAGVAADWLAASGASLTLGHRSADGAASFPALSLHGLDFVFAFAVLAGAYALRRLAMIQERGSLKDKLPLAEIAAEMRTTMRNVSNVAGLRPLWGFPYGILRRGAPGGDDGNGRDDESNGGTGNGDDAGD